MTVTIRYPNITDKEEFLAGMLASKSLHYPWTAPPINEKDFLCYLEKYESDTNISYLICFDEKIAGVININEIIRGSFQSAFLGYYVVNNFSGRGIMSNGLKKVMNEAFDRHGLHRLEANIQPENVASIRLVDQCGFKKEGFSPKYLNIMGKWCDHERWAITAEDFKLKPLS